jgi:hypothetical protein
MLYPLEKQHPETLFSAWNYFTLSLIWTGLHASLLLEVFCSESRDEILLRGEGCNTPSVYRLLTTSASFNTR